MATNDSIGQKSDRVRLTDEEGVKRVLVSSILGLWDVGNLDKRVTGIVATGEPHYLRDHSDNPWVRQFFNREVESELAA